MAARLADIVADLGGELRGDLKLSINRLASLDGAGAGDLSFLASAAHSDKLLQTRASCVITSPDLLAGRNPACAVLLTPHPHLYFARLTRWWVAKHVPRVPLGIHATAVVAKDAEVDPSSAIGPFVCIEPGARIGAGAVLEAHAYVGAGASVGAGARLHVRATLGAACLLGERSVLHEGAVVGSDGFGYAPHEGRWEKVEQLGAVRIGVDAEVGAHTCIDRGALDDTVIGDGVKLDNLVQIAHNVQIGDHTAAAACVGIAGSTRIGAHCMLGGAAMISGHLEIVDHVHISGGTVVMASIRAPGRYTGVFPITDHGAWEKSAAMVRQLRPLRERLRALEKKIT